jgi:predicted metal-dependent phosphoesterase TrpH
MTIKRDYHCHTNCSDGALTPQELLDRAYTYEVNELAITDHDTTRGYEIAKGMVDKDRLTLISGVEISCQWQNSTIHVVALDFEVSNQVLQEGLTLNRQIRRERADEMLNKLSNHKNAHIKEIVLDMRQQLKDPNFVVGRAHFAQRMVEKQLVKNIPQAFDRYLKRGRSGYAPVTWPDLEVVIGWILQAGGVAVLAHPKTYSMSNNKLNRLISDFKDAGGQAIEVITKPRMCAEQTGLIERAKRFDLAASLGSDFHRPEHHWRGLGWLAPWPENSITPVWTLFNKT